MAPPKKIDVEMDDLKSLVKTLQKQNAVLLEENAEIKQRLSLVEEKLEKVDYENKKKAIDKCRNSVVIKGIPLHKEAKDGLETKKQTQETMKNFISLLDVGTELGFTEAVRFKGNQEEGLSGLMKLSVSTSKQKGKIFEGLSKAAKKGNLKKLQISVTDEVPQFLRQKKAILEKKAYEIRQKEKGTKTRVFFQGIDIVLKKKGKKDERFVSVSDEEQDSSSDEFNTPTKEIPEENENLDQTSFESEHPTPQQAKKIIASRGRGNGKKRS